MDGIRIRTAVGALAAVAVLGLAACGGGGGRSDGGGGSGEARGGADAGAGDAASGGGGGGGGAAGKGDEVDVCRLLEVSEIDAQFGQAGAVSEGAPGELGVTALCRWQVGDPVSPEGGGTVTLGASTERDDIFYSVTGDPVAGLGDEAVLATESELHIRSGEQFLVLMAGIYPEVPGTRDKLVTLARLVVDRL